MAILTRKGMYDLLARIMDSGGMSEAMEKDVQRLKDDFDEREGMLRRYGEVYDGEDKDEYEYEERERRDDAAEKDWESRYNDLKDRYTKRFFSNPDVTTPDTVVLEAEEDVKRDGTVQTFDELLKRVEG